MNRRIKKTIKAQYKGGQLVAFRHPDNGMIYANISLLTQNDLLELNSRAFGKFPDMQLTNGTFNNLAMDYGIPLKHGQQLNKGVNHE